jgi:uncharacterized protein YoxC
VSVWSDGVEGHQTYQSLTAAQASIDGISGLEDIDQLALLSRARAAISAIRAALAAVDPQLLADATLDRIAPEANQIRDSAAAFSDGHDGAHLATMESNVASILNELGLGAFFSPGVVDALRDSLTRYRRAGRQFVEELESDVTTTRNQAKAVAARLASLDGQITEETAKVGTEVTAKIAPIDARVSDLAANVAAEATRVTTLIANQTKAFEDATAEEQRQFLEFMSAREETLNKAEAGATNAARAQRTRIQADADQVLADLRQQEQDARAVVSSIGALGITGGFGEYAHQQKRRADIWNVVTVLSLIVASIPGAVYFISVNLGIQQPVDLERFLERILTGGPLYVIAGYAAIQAARSRENERWARSKELELAAVGPYLALLTEGERNAVLVELAPKYFGLTAVGNPGNEGIAAARIIQAIEESAKQN